ncbi:MAG TPA: aminoacyl-tRNA hydrolase [Vicinamibacterales bacterium]|nr:aminoacyl-tRNA hydrolase [Vicinamibacterales bacterium]
MKLIAGLGNPGRRYRDTRHNVGFRVVDELARRAGVDFGPAPADALVARIRDFEGRGPVLLVKPLTMMNASGEAVAALGRYYRIEPDALLVITDDVNLPLARLRARARGSSGGHNGLRSVVQHLGTEAFPRLRVGVGRGDRRVDLADHVLATFDPEERPIIEAAIMRAADAAALFVAAGIEAVMNRFNPATEDGGNSSTQEAQADKQA